MRIELPGYDVNYRDGSDHNTPAGKKIAELNSFLRENGIRGGIACLDEKGQTVQRYTDHVVLEIDDSTPPETLEKVKEHVSELLTIMEKTHNDVKDTITFNENMGGYEKEKFGYMKQKLQSLIETMDVIGKYVDMADKLGIHVKKDFTFDSIYRTGGFDGRNGKVDFNDLIQKFEGYSYNLQTAVNNGPTTRRLLLTNMSKYEREKFGYMKEKLQFLIKIMDVIGEYVYMADKLGIHVKKDFTFDSIYRTGGFDGRNGKVDFKDLIQKFEGYSYNLQTAVNEKKVA